ncbi:MAG: O-antigen ligase family protein [Clostridiales bacterium]|nr:O-antigen ligase family protein [Clostridiales bacterium]
MSSKNKSNNNNMKINILMIPLILVITIIPMIMKLKTYDPNISQFTWYASMAMQYDFFLYYKQWVLISVALVMFLIVLGKVYINRNITKPNIIFAPLAIYALCIILSMIFSISKYHSVMGGIEQFESGFALLSYCIIVYYAFLFVKTEDDIKFFLKYVLIAVLIISSIGFLQFIGHDFFTTGIGQRLVTSREYIQLGGRLDINFGKGRVYLTLYNPNYVGVYVSLMLPLFIILLLFSKKLSNSLLYILAIVGLVICEIGSQSLAGLVGIIAAVIGILIFMWRYLLKRFYIVIPVFILFIGTLYLANKATDSVLINKIISELNMTKVEKNLTEITTLDDSVAFTYKGKRVFISSEIEDGYLTYNVKDAEGNSINTYFDENTSMYKIDDDDFTNFSFGTALFGEHLGFSVKIDGADWYFIKSTEDNTYYIINKYGRLDKAITPPDTFITGYEEFASKRGFIWSRTLTFLKDYIFIGAGPDNYIFAYPQQDYVGYYNYFPNMLLTKPHSMYLQIAVQTGLLSLLAFLVFYGMYFVSSIKLYIRGRFSSLYSQVGVAIFIASISYMIVGITNDSSITTAPVFWTLIGIGIVCNMKAKPLILEERRLAKEQKNKKVQGDENQTFDEQDKVELNQKSTKQTNNSNHNNHNNRQQKKK